MKLMNIFVSQLFEIINFKNSDKTDVLATKLNKLSKLV